MLKRYLCLILVLQLTSVGFSKILFEEDFSNSLSIDSPNAQIQTGSLNFKFHEETGNRLYLKDYNDGIRYNLDSELFSPQINKTQYLSFSIRSLNKDVKSKFAGIIFYEDNKEVFGIGNDYGSDYFSFWEGDGRGIIIGNGATYVDNDIHKIIMRIEYNPDGPETIKIGIDPFCLRTESRQPDHIWTTYEAELSFDEIRIRCGNDDSIWEFDDLCIATDWKSVTPPNTDPGEYVKSMIESHLPSGAEEMILEDVARFWPAGIDISAVPPSLALQKQLSAISVVPSSWELKPVFGKANGKKYAYFDIETETDLYGTGEVTGSLLRNGYKIHLFNRDDVLYNRRDQLYQSHPWVMGVRDDGSAFGILFDTTWIAELDLSAGILFTVSDDSPYFPVIVVQGKSPQQVTEKLGELIGTTPMPPRWALGYQQCRWSYYPDSRAREIADTFRAKQIPCDVIWFDIHYMDQYRIFTFDSNRFPDPKATNDYLHKLGYKSVWMIDPGVKYDPGYWVYDQGTEKDAWVKRASEETYAGAVWPGDCVFPDFTMPEVRSWWSGLYKDFMATGIDGVWNDMNEPAVFNGGSLTMPMDNIHRGGQDIPAGPHKQYHNVYGMLMTKASREGIQSANPNKRPFVLTRANYLGGHRYAATWTGDNCATWEHLEWSIPMSINLSLSGQSFNGPDIGGFAHNATADLWGHWISVGAFYPFSRAHTSDGTNNQEPWEFGPEVENTARIALQRRYRLMPYLYTVFCESHKTGLPVMRPMYFADPADKSLRMEDSAFMLGSDIIIIPKWAENVKHPKGFWPVVSLVGEDSTSDKYQCDIEVRAGSIVPLGPVLQTTEQIEIKQQLTLVVVLDEDGKASGSVYEDAGDGYDYKDGQFCLTSFTAQKQGDRVIVKSNKQQGDILYNKRMVAIEVIDADGVHHGFGDICDTNGISVFLTK